MKAFSIAALVPVAFSVAMLPACTGTDSCGRATRANSVNCSSKVVRVMKPTIRDLEEIRSAAISHYEARQDDAAKTFVAELRRGAPDIASDVARIGIWILERKSGELALVRQPPVSREMRYFGLWLERKDGRWRAKDDFQEIEKLQLDE
jgi:hypothetical protein